MVKKTNRISLSKLRNHLDRLSREELIAEISILFKYPMVRDYYTDQLIEDRSLLELYKKKITLEYFPKRGLGKRKNSHVRQLFSVFKKTCNSKIDLLELNLWRVEQALNYARVNKEQNQAFYKPVFNSFEDAIKAINTFHLMPKYENRIDGIINFNINNKSLPTKEFDSIYRKWR